MSRPHSASHSDEVVHQGFPAAGFRRELIDGLAQQVVPGAGRFRLRAAMQGGAVDDTALERVVLILAEYLTGGGHHLAVQTLLPVQVAQRSENAVDFYPGEARARRHAELTLHVVRRVQHHAACRFAVPAGAAGLLKIILQRARDVGVDDQPHVRLVYPHAEGVGGRNRAQFAADEAPLHVFPGLRWQTRMKMVGRHPFQLQELRHLLALPACRAIDDGATRQVRWQVRRQNLVDVGELLAPRCRNHLERQVGTFGAAVEDLHRDAELVPEVAHDVPGHVRLGGRGQAQHRRHRPGARLLPDEAGPR